MQSCIELMQIHYHSLWDFSWKKKKKITYIDLSNPDHEIKA